MQVRLSFIRSTNQLMLITPCTPNGNTYELSRSSGLVLAGRRSFSVRGFTVGVRVRVRRQLLLLRRHVVRRLLHGHVALVSSVHIRIVTVHLWDSERALSYMELGGIASMALGNGLARLSGDIGIRPTRSPSS